MRCVLLLSFVGQPALRFMRVPALRFMRVPALGFIGVLALAGCDSGPPLTGQAQADAATRAACRQRANEVYNQQNRSQIYSPQSSVNTPFSANYTPDQTDRGLSDLFAHDRLVNDCVRNTGTESDRNSPQPPTPPSPAKSP